MDDYIETEIYLNAFFASLQRSVKDGEIVGQDWYPAPWFITEEDELTPASKLAISIIVLQLGTKQSLNWLRALKEAPTERLVELDRLTRFLLEFAGIKDEGDWDRYNEFTTWIIQQLLLPDFPNLED